MLEFSCSSSYGHGMAAAASNPTSSDDHVLILEGDEGILRGERETDREKGGAGGEAFFMHALFLLSGPLSFQKTSLKVYLMHLLYFYEIK